MEYSTTGNDDTQEMGQHQAGNRPMYHSGLESLMFQTAVRACRRSRTLGSASRVQWRCYVNNNYLLTL